MFEKSLESSSTQTQYTTTLAHIAVIHKSEIIKPLITWPSHEEQNNHHQYLFCQCPNSRTEFIFQYVNLHAIKLYCKQDMIHSSGCLGSSVTSFFISMHRIKFLSRQCILKVPLKLSKVACCKSFNVVKVHTVHHQLATLFKFTDYFCSLFLS